MPQIARITSTFFTNLINRLGIRPPFNEGFEVSNVVQPVSLVDSDITLSAVTSTQTLGTAQTNGPLSAPAANAVMADSQAQTAGTYSLFIMASTRDGVGVGDFYIQRRDSANAANIWEQRFYTSNSQGARETFSMRVTLGDQERIRVVVSPAGGGGGSVYHANIWITPVT